MAEEATQTEETQEAPVPEWASGIEDEGVRTFASQYESQDDVLKAIGYEPPKPPEEVSWKDQIKDKKIKEFADSSSDINHFADRAYSLFKKLNGAVIKPGKDATDEDIAAYRKAMNIPAEPKGYEFPDIAEDELTEDIKQNRQVWSQRFHDLGVTKEQGLKLAEMVNEDQRAFLEAQAKSDKAFAEKQAAELKSDWKGDFDKNRTFAVRAFQKLANMAGLDTSDLEKIETKDGQLLMDRADMLRIFSAVGREMSEGTLGPVVTESEKETLEKQVEEIRDQIREAQEKGQSKKADQLYQKEQALIGRLIGDQPIVGSQGRAA